MFNPPQCLKITSPTRLCSKKIKIYKVYFSGPFLSLLPWGPKDIEESEGGVEGQPGSGNSRSGPLQVSRWDLEKRVFFLTNKANFDHFFYIKSQI